MLTALVTMRFSFFPWNQRTGGRVCLLVAGFLVAGFPLADTSAFAAGTAEKLNRANELYEEAEEALTNLQEIPSEQRSRKDYENVIRAFRRIYRTAPTSPHNAKSLLTIGELYQAMGRNLKDQNAQKYFTSAVEVYDFLLEEYPYSRYQPDALLAIARIYQLDLKQPEEALRRFNLYLKKYPNSAQTAEVRGTISGIESEKAGGKLSGAQQGPTNRQEPKAKSETAVTDVAPAPPARPQIGLGLRQADTVGQGTQDRSLKTGERASISEIRQWVTVGFTRVVIAIDQEVKYEVDKLSNPPRIYLDFHGVKIDRAVPLRAAGEEGGLIKLIRVGQHSLEVVRVVLELDRPSDYTLSELPNPYRLIIDIYDNHDNHDIAKPAKTEARAPQTPATTASHDPQPNSLTSAETNGQKPAAVTQTEAAAKPSGPLPAAALKDSVCRGPCPETAVREKSDPVAVVRAANEAGVPKRQDGFGGGVRERTTPVAVKADPDAVPERKMLTAQPEGNGSRSTLPSTEKFEKGPDNAPNQSPDTAKPSLVSKDVLPAPPTSDAMNREPAAMEKPNTSPFSETAQPARPNRNGTRSLTRALGLKIGTIILDPGHGGHDTGTIGPTGLYEKDLVLDVALRLGKLIGERLGSEVVYTRQDDTFVALESRTAIANEKQADLFLSIHANSSSYPSARGVETYYLSFNSDPDALNVAARENADSQESIHELQDLVKKIALNEKLDESKEFAADLQSALWDRLYKNSRQKKDRGVKKAPFVVLVGAKMPSVLAEICFLSNPQEEKLLRTEAQRQKIAEALYAGIEKYAATLSGTKTARTDPGTTVARTVHPAGRDSGSPSDK